MDEATLQCREEEEASVVPDMNRRASSSRASPHKSTNHIARDASSSSSSSCSISSSKLLIHALAIFVIFLVLWQIQQISSSSAPASPWALKSHWDKLLTNSTTRDELNAMAEKLRQSVTFLPLKDLRYASEPMKGHTWFMSSLYDTQEPGEVQYQEYPADATGGRVLCLQGRDRHDGAWNSYALAWAGSLPRNATFLSGTTFISYNHYDYHNIWHGLSAMMSFVAWQIKSACASPERWILYHWGELRTSMAPWVATLLEATFGGTVKIDDFGAYDDAVCFERAVVMRHNEGGMSSEKRMAVYDLMRCRARMFCEIGKREEGVKVGVTMLMRDGARSFRNASAVVGIFEEECRRVAGCRLTVAYPHNLTFCDQVTKARARPPNYFLIML